MALWEQNIKQFLYFSSVEELFFFILGTGHRGAKGLQGREEPIPLSWRILGILVL
jgi:hypothetical protein